MTLTWIKDLESPHLVETAWERQMQLSGLEDYENARSKTDPSSTVAGKKLIRKLLVKAEEAIEEMQRTLINKDRVERSLKATVISIPPETLALIVLKQVIDKTYSTTSPERGAGWQAVCTQIATACETELNFRHWVDQSREVARAYARAKGLASTPPSLADRMIAESGSGRRQMLRWRNTIKELSEYEWEIEEKHFCGDALLACVVDAMPKDFERIYVSTAMGNKKFVRMSDATRKKFDDVEYSVSTAQTVRKPMLTKPRRWVAN